MTTTSTQGPTASKRRDSPLDSPVPTHVSITENRFGTRASKLLVEHVNKLELDDELVSLEHYVLTDLAHAVMLTNTGIFDAQHGARIIDALLKLRNGDTFAMLSPDPVIGTLGLQIEQYLERALGPQGKDIQRARSRIDQKATNWRLVNRDSLTEVIEELTQLGVTILATAEQYSGVLMPGYTHLQHSQPTTIDHYLNAHYWAVSRCLDRLLDAYDRLNVCPLGGAAYSGTAWPINRKQTASYLGFDGPILNARDAGMASTDMGAELASVLAMTLSALSRLAGDLNYWASSEVGLVRVAVSLSGTSSAMPQKRNPMVLERIRGLAGVSVGWAASQLGVQHTMTSTDVDQAYIHNLFPGQCAETTGAIALLREVIGTIEFDLPRLHASSGQHWSTASALADALVASRGMSFRDAHEAVASLVAAHERAGSRVGELCPELIENKFLQEISASELSDILSPEVFVATRTSPGGTSSNERAKLAAAATSDLEDKNRRLRDRTNQVTNGLQTLLKDAHVLTLHILEASTP